MAAILWATMNETQTDETYKKEITIGAIALFSVAAVVALVTLVIYNNQPKITHQPATACDLLTTEEASGLLGGKTIRTTIKDPEIDGDTATSSCGYTDGNADMEKAVVAAINVRAAINDKGAEQNKTEFAAGRPRAAKEVKNVGERAYWNLETGQLNLLSGRNWVIISYGVGATPEANTLDDAIKLAKKVLN